MSFTLATPSKMAMLNVLVSEAGTTSTISIYSGVMPTNADTALSGNTVLVSLPCSAIFALAYGLSTWAQSYGKDSAEYQSDIY